MTARLRYFHIGTVNSPQWVSQLVDVPSHCSDFLLPETKSHTWRGRRPWKNGESLIINSTPSLSFNSMWLLAQFNLSFLSLSNIPRYIRSWDFLCKSNIPYYIHSVESLINAKNSTRCLFAGDKESKFFEESNSSASVQWRMIFRQVGCKQRVSITNTRCVTQVQQCVSDEQLYLT